MKKGLLITVIVGLVLLISGKIIMNIADDNNSEWTINDDENGELSINSNNTSKDNTKVGEIETINKEFDNVENLKLSLGIYKVLIQGDKNIDKIQINAKKPVCIDNGIDIDKLLIDCKDGNLTISQKRDKNSMNFESFNSNNYKGELIIKIPMDKVIDGLSIDNGVGSIEVNDLTIDKLDIECGTSSIVCNNLKLGDCEISGGTGSIIFELNGNENDYNFEIKSGLGSIKINDNKYKKEANINNGSEKTIEVNTGTGSVEIKTK